jgi:hypothetical protein
MGTAQSFAGVSRVVAPLLATRAFQDLGHGSPFYIAGGFVALVSLLSFRIHPHRAEPTPIPPEPAGSGAAGTA